MCKSVKSGYLMWTIVIISMLLSACGVESVAPPDGVIYALQYGTTLHGVKQALNGATGAQIFLREATGNVTFVWPFQDGWAYFSICQQGCTSMEEAIRNTGGKASLLNANDMRKVREIMEYNGWKLITAAEVPTAVKTALVNVTAAADVIGSTFFTWVVFPFVPATVPDGAMYEIQ